MGMYDTVICKYPLPMPDDPKGYAGSEDFQTKHLDCGLDTYEIAVNGQLSVHKREGNYIEGDKEAKGLFDKIGRYEVTRTWIDGILDEIKLIGFEATDNAERKKKDKEFDKKLKEWYEFTKTRKYKYFVGPYNKSIKFIFRKISKILSFLSSKVWILESKFLI